MANLHGAAQRSNETMDRMMRAAPELVLIWVNHPAFKAGATSHQHRPWRHRFDFDRYAWLFEQLSSLNRRGVEDSELLSMAIAIDTAMLSCVYDTSPHGEIEKIFGPLEFVETVAEFEEYRIALARQYQPARTAPTSRKFVSRESDQDWLFKRLQRSNSSAERAQALVAFRRRIGLVSDSATKHEELKWLISCLEQKGDYANLHTSWYGVSKWTRDQVARYAYQNNYEIRIQMKLDRSALLSACREALRTPAFRRRPVKFAERSACRLLRRFVEQLYGPRSWFSNDCGRVVPKAGLDLAMQISKKYEIAFSENHFKGLR